MNQMQLGSILVAIGYTGTDSLLVRSKKDTDKDTKKKEPVLKKLSPLIEY